MGLSTRPVGWSSEPERRVRYCFHATSNRDEKTATDYAVNWLPQPETFPQGGAPGDG